MLLLVPDDAANAVCMLKRLDTPPSGPSLGPEAWLQRRFMVHPELLLTGQASARHGTVKAVCCELPLLSGFADWLGITTTGEIVLAEVKLGRNAEARREIIAQALDYYAALRSLSYDELEAAARRGAPTALSTETGLYELSGNVMGADSLSPDEFRARVEANLRTGAILLVLALDRAPPSLVRLVEGAFMDQPALPFHVALLECNLYEMQGQGVVIAPTLRARLISRERAVVRVEGQQQVAAVAEAESTSVVGSGKAVKRSQMEFLEELERQKLGMAGRLTRFLEQVQPLGLVPEVSRTMVLRLDGVNMGSVNVSGIMELYLTEPARQAGRDAFLDYIRSVARIAEVEPPAEVIAGMRAIRVPVSRLLDGMDDWVSALREWQDMTQAGGPGLAAP